MQEHTHIHFIHGLAAFLMVVWFFMLLTMLVARFPDSSFAHVVRQTVPLGDAATEAATPTVRAA